MSPTKGTYKVPSAPCIHRVMSFSHIPISLNFSRDIALHLNLQEDLQNQCNPYQNSNCFFCRNGHADPKTHMEMQRTLKRQKKKKETTEKEE